MSVVAFTYTVLYLCPQPFCNNSSELSVGKGGRPFNMRPIHAGFYETIFSLMNSGRQRTAKSFSFYNTTFLRSLNKGRTSATRRRLSRHANAINEGSRD